MNVKICDFCGKILDPKDNVSFRLHNNCTPCAPNPKVEMFFDLCEDCRIRLTNRIEKKMESINALIGTPIQEEEKQGLQ